MGFNNPKDHVYTSDPKQECSAKAGIGKQFNKGAEMYSGNPMQVAPDTTGGTPSEPHQEMGKGPSARK